MFRDEFSQRNVLEPHGSTDLIASAHVRPLTSNQILRRPHRCLMLVNANRAFCMREDTSLDKRPPDETHTQLIKPIYKPSCLLQVHYRSNHQVLAARPGPPAVAQRWLHIINRTLLAKQISMPLLSSEGKTIYTASRKCLHCRSSGLEKAAQYHNVIHLLWVRWFIA